jgi:hypothetical protein
MKYRIKKTTDLDGLFIFLPQFKWFIFYLNFWEVSFPPHKICFRNYEAAESFIKMQRLKPKDEIYYL